MLDFDEQREANIARNRQLLASLGLGDAFKATLPPKAKAKSTTKSKPPKAKPKPKATRKRKASASDEGTDEDEEPARKVARANNDAAAELRRSGRNAGRKVDYSGDGAEIKRDDSPYVFASEVVRRAATEPKRVLKRVHDPKTFGSIPGVPVGTWWETREACSLDAIHAPWVGGISGGPKGAWSVALSGGYEDDIDIGEAFTYTGAGGRDLKGTKKKPKNLRTGPQSYDQTFENNGNRALLKSVETQKPVRVIRGYKSQPPYAPPEGYRYDGLYTVEKAWREKGLNPKGYLVCKFLFKRVPGQPPLPRTGEDDNDIGSVEGSEEESGGDEDQSEDASARDFNASQE